MRYLFVLLMLPALAAQAQEVEVGAALNRSTARVGETVLLTVSLRAAGLHSPDIEDPELSGLELLSAIDRSSVRFSTPLGAIREFSREYTLRVLQAGELTIPPILATVDGVRYETKPLSLIVEREGAALDLPGRLAPRPEEEVAVRLWVEPETAYVGQQVTLNVAAFFDPLVRNRLQRQPEYRPPELRGFWTTDLPGSPRPERRVVGRREYFVQTYRRALFPLSDGTFQIPAASVVYEVRRGLIYAPETFQVESAPATVAVVPLPGIDVPADFAGAVGRYTAEVWFDRSDLRAGEAVNLVLEVQGSGNLSSIGRPRLPEVAGIRVYEGGEDAEVQLRGVEFAGHKRFYWVLVPERPGRYVLPELRLPYFDPLAGVYQVARTEPVSLSVDPAPVASGLGAAPGTGIRFLKGELGREPLYPHRRPVFWIVAAAPSVLLLGLVGFGRFRSRLPAVARTAAPRRQRVLRSLRPLAESGDSVVFGELRSAILGWLETRLHAADLSSSGVMQVKQTLEDAGVPPPMALEVIELLEQCSRLRYAPNPPGAPVALALLSKAERVLALVDKEAVSQQRLRSPAQAGGSLTVILLLGAALSPAAAQTGGEAGVVEAWFQQGVQAYGRGDHALAVELFERAHTLRPGDPSLLYNLGNAYYELDQRGKAVAHWVRTLQVRPRDGDARFNLRAVVGDDPLLGSALPPLPLSEDELAWLLLTFWLVAMVALMARRRWRRGYLAVFAGGAFTLAVLVAALMFYPRAGYAVISAPDSALRAGPVQQSEILATPVPGTGFRVEEQRGDWLRVSRGGDSEGWVEREQVELID